MATKSGMNYSKIEDLINYLESQKGIIEETLTELEDEAPGRIATHYSGQAAETYKSTLDTVIKNITSTLNDMIKQLNENTLAKKAEYMSQDAKLQESTQDSIQELTQQTD